MFLRIPLLALPLLLAPGGPGLRGPEYPFWGDLESGPHGVGFHTDWMLDHSRTYDTTFADGSRHAESKAPRPLLVNVWYPAVVDDADERMVHGDYFEIGSKDPRLDRLARELARYAEDGFVEWTLGKKPPALDDWDRGELERLLTTPTACVPDAEPAEGRFPLLVFHSGYGSSFEDNSVFCEYLASHGYVVVGSAFLDETGGSFNIDGREGSARDLAFLIDAFHDDPRVDWKHVAIAGHSGGAHVCLRFQARPRAPIEAVISLDTTQDYVSALDPHWLHTEAMRENIDAETTPLLVVAGPHAFFQACDALIHSERTYLTFRELDHNDYTSQGILCAEVAARRAQATRPREAEAAARDAATRRRGFEQCTDYIRLFLDARLKQSTTARELLASLYRRPPAGGELAHAEFVPVGTTTAAPYPDRSSTPPSPRQVRPFLREHGPEALLEIYERFRVSHPAAPLFHQQFAYALLYELVATGKEDQAALLAPAFHAWYPGLVGTYLWWTGRSSGDRYRDYRRYALKTARLLEPDNQEVARRLAQELAAP